MKKPVLDMLRSAMRNTLAALSQRKACLAFWILGLPFFFLLFSELAYIIISRLPLWLFWVYPAFSGYPGFFSAFLLYLSLMFSWTFRSFLFTLLFTRKNLFRLLTFGTTTMAGLALLEWVARGQFPAPLYNRGLPATPFVHETRTYIDLPGISPERVLTTNEWGLRADPFPRDRKDFFILLTIGGSTTICDKLDDFKTWPYLLQQKMTCDFPRVWVGNAGFVGHTTRGHLLVMDRFAEPIRPHAMIILVGVNDLELSLREKERVHGNGYDRSQGTTPYGPLGPLAGMRLFQLAHHWRVLEAGRKIVVHDENFYASHQKREKADLPIPQDLREILPSLPGYRRNLHQIMDQAERMNARVLFLTQPSLYDNTPYWRSKPGRERIIDEKVQIISAATHWSMMEIFNEELLAVCQERGVPCFDLASHLGHDASYFYDFCHFTESGAEAVVRLISGPAREYLIQPWIQDLSQRRSGSVSH